MGFEAGILRLKQIRLDKYIAKSARLRLRIKVLEREAKEGREWKKCAIYYANLMLINNRWIENQDIAIVDMREDLYHANLRILELEEELKSK